VPPANYETIILKRLGLSAGKLLLGSGTLVNYCVVQNNSIYTMKLKSTSRVTSILFAHHRSHRKHPALTFILKRSLFLQKGALKLSANRNI